ncbi:MAG: PilW family protein [Pseudomonadales bacterium]|nr:PilW family protein [Pseudomonadales bacterium]
MDRRMLTRDSTKLRGMVSGSISRRHSGGFSMVELILALGLGLVVTAGIVQLFVGNNQTYSLLTGQSRLQESARYAMEFITQSARSAGYFGCDPENDKIYNTLNGPWTSLYEMDLTNPIQAYNYTGNGTATGPGDWTPTLAPLPRVAGPATNMVNAGTGIDLTTVIPGTDFLVFRRVEIPGAPIAGIVQPNTNPIVVIDEGDFDFAVNDFAVISNCEQAALFRITGVAAGPAAPSGEPTFSLTRGAGAGIYENAAGRTLSDEGIPYGTGVNGQATTVGRVITDIYYIARGAGVNNRGQNPRALWRRSGTTAPVELVEGVENLQVLVGIDNTPTDNNNSANRYIDFNALGATDIVRSLRIEVTTSTVDVVTDGNAPVSRTFVQTISMRNA